MMKRQRRLMIAAMVGAIAGVAALWSLFMAPLFGVMMTIVDGLLQMKGWISIPILPLIITYGMFCLMVGAVIAYYMKLKPALARCSVRIR